MVRVASLFGVSYLIQSLGPAASTWVAHVDLFVHLPFLSVDAQADGLTKCVPVFVHNRWSPSAVFHSGSVDEGAQHSRRSRSKSELVHPSLDDRILVNLCVELVLDHLDCLRVLLQVDDLCRFVVVHLDEPPSPVRGLQPPSCIACNTPCHLFRVAASHADVFVVVFRSLDDIPQSVPLMPLCPCTSCFFGAAALQQLESLTSFMFSSVRISLLFRFMSSLSWVICSSSFLTSSTSCANFSWRIFRSVVLFATFTDSTSSLLVSLSIQPCFVPTFFAVLVRSLSRFFLPFEIEFQKFLCRLVVLSQCLHEILDHQFVFVQVEHIHSSCCVQLRRQDGADSQDCANELHSPEEPHLLLRFHDPCIKTRIDRANAQTLKMKGLCLSPSPSTPTGENVFSPLFVNIPPEVRVRLLTCMCCADSSLSTLASPSLITFTFLFPFFSCSLSFFLSASILPFFSFFSVLLWSTLQHASALPMGLLAHVRHAFFGSSCSKLQLLRLEVFHILHVF